jgi:2-amino-4-hydroxy-6-hydroxymethyldihydropteridine diphosphokinase
MGVHAPRLVVFGLGANLGDRLASMRDAARALAVTPGLTHVTASTVVETAAMGGPPQPAYLNAAVRAVATLEARTLLDKALSIERALGRDRAEGVRWGPRTIDIDLLWIEGEEVSEPGLVVPHPRLVERAFALVPLVELVPGACDPAGRRYADLVLARVALDRVARLEV